MLQNNTTAGPLAMNSTLRSVTQNCENVQMFYCFVLFLLFLLFLSIMLFFLSDI